MPKRYKNLSLKKKEKEKLKIKKVYKTLLKKTSTRKWLITIRKINIRTKRFGFTNVDHKAEFLVVCVDMALRIAKDEDTSFPDESQIGSLISAEIQLSDSQNNLIKLFGLGGISLLANWQNRFSYNVSNMLGRMTVLYKDYDETVITAVGISLKDIYIIFMALFVLYDKSNSYFLDKKKLVHESIEGLSLEKIDKFFEYFSISKEEYIQKAKEKKIYENSFGKFKFLIRYPIIKLKDGSYIIPVFEQLIDTITNNMYFLLLEYFSSFDKKTSKAYLDDFGIKFEDYVLELSRDIFSDNEILDANDIVTNRHDDRCEFVLTNNDNALAIEVKKMYYKLDAIENIDKEYIDLILERHIVKAFKQIESTFNYLQQKVKYGIIVIPDIMISLDSIKSYIKKSFENEAQFLDNIFICNLSSFEELISNSKDNIFSILEETMNQEAHEGKDFIFVIQKMKNKGYKLKMSNKKLMKATEKILMSIKEKLTK